MVPSFLNKFGKNRERVNQIKEELRAQQQAEQQLLSNNERNLNRMIEQKRQDLIKQRFQKMQQKESHEMFAKQNVLTGKNFFKDNQSMLRERNLFRHKKSLMNQPNLFRGHR